MFSGTTYLLRSGPHFPLIETYSSLNGTHLWSSPWAEGKYSRELKLCNLCNMKEPTSFFILHFLTSFLHWVIIPAPVKILLFTPKLKRIEMILTSSCIALLNSCYSLSKICAYLPHSSDMVGAAEKKVKRPHAKLSKHMQQQAHKYHVTSVKLPKFLIGWFFSFQHGTN